MKGETIFVAIFALLLALTSCSVGAGLVGVFWYSQPSPTPSYSTPVVIEVEKVVEVEKEIPIKVVETVEVVVTATPQLTEAIVYQEPIIISTPTKRPCTNIAWIEQQPRDAIQGSAMKAGTIYRMNVSIVNLGTCDWIGYKLVSIGETPLEVDVPATYPGQTATWVVDENLARFPINYKLLMMDDLGNYFPFENGSLNDGSLNWKMEVYSKTTQIIQGSDGIFYECGVNG